MFRAHRASPWFDVAWRLLTPVLAIALAMSFAAGAPAPVEAGASGLVAPAIEKAQRKAEASMRRADRSIKRLQKQRQQQAKRLEAAKRKLEKVVGQRDKARHKAKRTQRHLDDKERILARTLRVHPEPRGRQVADKPALRKQVRQLEAKIKRIKKQVRKSARKIKAARKAKQARARAIGKAGIKARKRSRERAEDTLAARISQMLDLSRARADKGFGAASARGFMRPAKGTISQRYGCTGYAANKRRGSCAHFHDGVDIATGRGARVRASADGYVAYVGFNPWDKGSRAFIVIIGHAHGYESIYAHLKAVRKVRAGQRVERGDVIGVVGMTGHTSGPHVHWEVSRDFRTQNPFRAGR